MTRFTSRFTNVVSKKPIIGGIILAAIIGVVFAGAQINPDNPENEGVWSIRMASPEWDDRQTVRASLPNLEEGTYKIGFVPMGDSPSKIRIDIKEKSTTTSPNFYFSEEFVLKGTQVDTDISTGKVDVSNHVWLWAIWTLLIFRIIWVYLGSNKYHSYDGCEDNTSNYWLFTHSVNDVY